MQVLCKVLFIRNIHGIYEDLIGDSLKKSYCSLGRKLGGTSQPIFATMHSLSIKFITSFGVSNYTSLNKSSFIDRLSH